jgi:hypothetical protein
MKKNPRLIVSLTSRWGRKIIISRDVNFDETDLSFTHANKYIKNLPSVVNLDEGASSMDLEDDPALMGGLNLSNFHYVSGVGTVKEIV